MSLIKYLSTAVIILLIVGVAPLGPTGMPRLHGVFATTHNLSLIGNLNGWNLSKPGPTITALQGDTINIQFTQPDTQHRFYVDVDKNQIPDCPTPDKCGPSYSTPTSFTFTVDFGPGSYKYYCSIHPSMVGTFDVPSPDFSITPAPSSMTLIQGSSQSSTITVSSLNGFSGTVNLSLPNTPAGISAQFITSPSLSVTPSSSGVSTLNITAGAATARGSYMVPVMGSNGTISHSASVSITIIGPPPSDFVISSDSSSLSIVVGSSRNATIHLTSQNSFAGNVNLAATVSPLGPTLSLNPLTVSLTSGGSATSTLSIATTSGLYSSTATGTYTVTVKATGSPSLSHSVTLSATVTSQSSSPAAGNIPVYVLVIAGVAILAIVVVVAYAVMRRKPGK